MAIERLFALEHAEVGEVSREGAKGAKAELKDQDEIIRRFWAGLAERRRPMPVQFVAT